MSRPNNNGSSDVPLEEDDEEAFIDLDDPDNEILDEDKEPPIQEEEDDNEGDGEDGKEDNNDESSPANDAQPESAVPAAPAANVVDLNVVEDVVPDRDDAVSCFAPAPHPDGSRKAIHALSTLAVSDEASSKLIVAAAGEADLVFILELQGDGSSVREIATLTGHTDTITQVQFSPNGTILATAGLDTTVQLWDVATWSSLFVLTDLSGEIATLLWHPSSLALFAGGSDGQGALWNVKKGSVAMYFGGHRGGITASLWTNDFKKLVTGSTDGSVIIFSPKTGEAESTVAKDLSPDTAGVSQLLLITDDVLVVGCEDGTMHLVSLSKQKCVAHLKELHEQCIESIQLAPAGLPFYASSSCDMKIVVWNTTDHSPRNVITVGESVIPLLWHGPHLVAGCSDGGVRVWDGRSAQQEPQQVFLGHRRMVLALSHAAAASCPRLLVSGSDDGSVRVFPLSS